MGYLIVMVGLPGSGKSTIIKNWLKNYSLKIFSSDNYRKIICGDESCQTRNQEVFTQLYKDLKESLKNGCNCVFDATNTTRKMRAKIFNQIQGIENVKVIAYVMKTPIQTCIERDKNRERKVGEDVIYKFLKGYEFPQKFEGFSNIIIDSFYPNLNIADDVSAHFIETIDKMQGFDQENPHHKYSLYEHCYKVAECFPESDSKWFAGILHDVGKLYTKFYDDQGIAHYYNHDNIGTYFVLSELIDFFNGKDQLFIEQLLFLVNYHMRGHKDFRDNNEFKYRSLFGDEWYDDLIEFANADMKASGTEEIHDKLCQWIKIDKCTLKDIRNKKEYINLKGNLVN